MRTAGPKYQIWQIMLAIAVIAGLLAIFGVTGAVVVLVVISALVPPILQAAPGRRLCATAWVCSLYPVLLLCSLYSTWFTAWWVLGNRPRMSLDDPKFISPIVQMPHDATFLLLLGSPFALLVCIPLVLSWVVQCVRRDGFRLSKATAQVMIPVSAWQALIVISRWNLFDFDSIFGWFMD
jgi:hypothetical protein